MTIGRFVVAVASMFLCCASTFAQPGFPGGGYTPPTSRYTPPSRPTYTPPSRPSYTPPSYTPPSIPSAPSYTPPSYTPPSMPRYEPPVIETPEINYEPSYSYTPPSTPQYDYEYETTCLSCNKVVSNSSKVGDKCPYCGVVWTHEENDNGASRNAAAIGRVVGVGISILVGIVALVGGGIAVASRKRKPTAYAGQPNVWHQQQNANWQNHNAWQNQYQNHPPAQQPQQPQQPGNFFSDWHQTG